MLIAVQGLYQELYTINLGFIYANSSNVRDYEYDKNGNLTADRNKGITKIEYNYLNLPMVITFTGNRSIVFVYDASGAKLQKIVRSTDTTTYNYVNGVEYTNGVLQRIAHTEGAVTRQTNGVYEHEYVLRDHLGNTRVTFSDANNDGIVTTAANELKQINSYYPFGLNMDGNFNGAAGKNKYAYNGKEWNDDFGLGWNHHDWRFLDVAINRFVTIDPKSEEDGQEQLSPYHFAKNNPILYDDPDGQCPTCFIGAIIGGAADYGFQVAANLAKGQDIKTSMTNINKTSIFISMTAGALTSGISAVEMAAAKKVGMAIATDATESALKQIDASVKKGEGVSVTLEQTASDVIANYAAGELTKKAGDIIDTKSLLRDADRTSRVSANDPASNGRASNASNAKSELNKAEKINHASGKAASGVVGNSLQLSSNTMRAPANGTIKYPQANISRDATQNNNIKPIIHKP